MSAYWTGFVQGVLAATCAYLVLCMLAFAWMMRLTRSARDLEGD